MAERLDSEGGGGGRLASWMNGIMADWYDGYSRVAFTTENKKSILQKFNPNCRFRFVRISFVYDNALSDTKICNVDRNALKIL